MKISRIMKSLALGGLITILGCNQPSDVPSTTNYNFPKTSEQGKKQIEQITNWNDVRKENFEYSCDMNMDGISDRAIMENSVVYFSKGIGENKFERRIPILKVEGDIRAYRIDAIQGYSRPGVIFFNGKGQGFFQPNIGANSEGIPFFGDVEELK